MKPGQKANLKIAFQGGPVVNDAVIIACGEHIAAVEVDLKSKFCEVAYQMQTKDGYPALAVCGTYCSLYLGKDNPNAQTEIVFEDFAGWDFYCVELARYTLKVCFYKKYLFLQKNGLDSQ